MWPDPNRASKLMESSKFMESHPSMGRDAFHEKEFHQVIHDLIQPSFENLQKRGFHSLSKALFQHLSTAEQLLSVLTPHQHHQFLQLLIPTGHPHSTEAAALPTIPRWNLN